MYIISFSRVDYAIPCQICVLTADDNPVCNWNMRVYIYYVGYNTPVIWSISLA